ncbi:kinase-like domain-containing protein [Aspergillus unguis]
MMLLFRRMGICSQRIRVAFSLRKCSTISPKGLVLGYDPYKYTSGRWLHQDELERGARQIIFDFPALCNKAISLCPGARTIVKSEKREGGFNRVFLFTMDTGSCVVARLPTSTAGPPRLTTNSEVATMTYLQSKTSLPIPKVLDWNDNPANPIGTEYIIQEHVAGVQLHQVWPKMNSEQHMLCTKTLSLVIRDLASLDFPAYGSLYFSDALESHMKVPLEQSFCVGPHCNPVFWNRNRGELELYGGPSPNCGPWKDLESYSLGLIETGFSRLPKNLANHEFLPYQGSIEEHIRLLKISQEVMQNLVKDKRIQDAAAPALLHPDLYKRNIYVSADDPTVITGLVDWQSAAVEPAFIYANETPDFAALLENTFDSGDEHSEQKRKDASICYQTYDVCMKGLVPKLRPARLLDPTLFRLFHYCHTTWRDSATAIRQELIDLSARWEELDLQGSCPFSPTEEELKQHARDYEDFETVQGLKSCLRDSLNTGSDGWVPSDVWDVVRDAHRMAYDEWMQVAREAESRGEGLTVAKADKLWPFDAR